MEGPTHRYMQSTPGCWAAFGRVLAREYEDQRYFEVHRLTVDAYAVQHPGIPGRQSIQSVAFHLVRLGLFQENGFFEETAFQFNIWADVTIVDCDRRLVSKAAPCEDEG